MVRISFSRSPREDASYLSAFIKKLAGTEKLEFEIRKKSLDARRGHLKFVYTADLFAPEREEKRIAKRCSGEIICREDEFVFPAAKALPKKRPVVAGFGPAGIFTALMLARSGFRPIVAELGKKGSERKKDVDAFFAGGELNESSNIQFGEGGAGAFSDGKLNTLVKDKNFRGYFVLKELVKAGAPEETLYTAKPHIGTDLLMGVVENLRKEITDLGGEIRFETKLEDIICENGRISGIVANGEAIETDALFLATGQSSRETAEMMLSHGAEIERKPFSVGFRIEHPQGMINFSQYGNTDELPFLPPAEYKLFTHCRTGRTVYSFCMCPGGTVVNASSENGRLVTNGMSFHARAGINANSAILCEVTPEDIGEGIFAGFDYRERLERDAFMLGGGDFTAPAIRLGDYLGKSGGLFEDLSPTYPRGVKFCDISVLFGKEMNDSFREAFADFGRKIKGFDSDNAVLTAVESRSSSPIRIKRFDDRQSNIKGIYPLGEGAGYAGGIISSAIDGVKSAEEYILALNGEK